VRVREIHMRRVIRWVLAAIVVGHGLIHLLGAAKGFRWATVTSLSQPISTMRGVVWLAAAILVTAAGVLLAARSRWWWVIAMPAAVVSQIAIVTSWRDARAGTVANVVLLAAAVYGYSSNGPRSAHATYRRLADQAIDNAAAPVSGVVTGEDLGHLPAPVAAYVAATGAIGKPHVVAFQARISGRIRSGPHKPWMPFTGEQTNTYGASPSRIFYQDATMRGLPVDVLHTYIGPAARMQVKAASLIPMVDTTGADMTQAETVTLLNDMCVLAPRALVDAPVEWTLLDDNRVSARYTNAGHTVSAELVFDDDHHLIDFISDDRLRSSQDGKTLTRERWSTPLRDYRTFKGHVVASLGYGRWHDPKGPFDYLEFHLDDITYLEADWQIPTPELRHRPVAKAT
jgi:hypothetical protein